MMIGNLVGELKTAMQKIHFDFENFVLVSARRIKKTGLFRYIMGFRKR